MTHSCRREQGGITVTREETTSFSDRESDGVQSVDCGPLNLYTLNPSAVQVEEKLISLVLMIVSCSSSQLSEVRGSVFSFLVRIKQKLRVAQGQIFLLCCTCVCVRKGWQDTVALTIHPQMHTQRGHLCHVCDHVHVHETDRSCVFVAFV